MFATFKHHFKVRVLHSLQSRSVGILLYVLHSFIHPEMPDCYLKTRKVPTLVNMYMHCFAPHTLGIQQKLAELSTMFNTKYKSYFYSCMPFFNFLGKTYKQNHCRILSQNWFGVSLTPISRII